MPTTAPDERPLLVTTTLEPFQPVRLYYSIPGRGFASRRLRRLECLIDAPEEGGWQWLFSAESASLTFPGGYNDVPQEKHPILLGRIRFPRGDRMTLQTNSFGRAIAAARFFAPYLGPQVILLRCRLVNRCFAASEGTPEELAGTLDHNVTVRDPREAEARQTQDFAGARTPEDFEVAAAKSLERRIAAKEDVPLVEDFPLAPEEETPDFSHLAMTLNLRLVRAMERWQGSTETTLLSIIMRMAQQEAAGKIETEYTYGNNPEQTPG